MAIYARLNPSDYPGWGSKAPAQKTNSSTTTRLPVVIDDHCVVATSQMAAPYFRQAAAETAAEGDDGNLAWAPFSRLPPTTNGDSAAHHAGLVSARGFYPRLGGDSLSPRRGPESGVSLNS